MRWLASRTLTVIRQRRKRAYNARRYAWAAALLLLVACSTTPTKTGERDTPPDVSQCRQHRTADIQSRPRFWWELPDALAEAVYLLAEERRLRALERDCIERMKAKGVIR